MKEPLPHRYWIAYKRTPDWWTGKGGNNARWYDLSTWCDASIGDGNWNYVDECFTFKRAEDKSMFIMRWL